MYACIYNTEIFDFLIDIIPAEDLKALKKFPAEGMLQVLPSNHSNPKWLQKSANEKILTIDSSFKFIHLLFLIHFKNQLFILSTIYTVHNLSKK